MRRKIVAAATVAAAGAISILVGACGGSSSTSQGSVAALKRAAYVSSAAPGYRAAVSLQEAIGSAHITATGAGSFSPPARTGSMTMVIQAPALGTAASNLQMQVVYVGDNYYVKIPPSLSGQIPGAKPWLRFNLGSLGTAAGIGGISSLSSSATSLNDPGQYLGYLRATSAGTVKDMGQATINGIKTTHYRTDVELSKIPDAVPADARKSAEQLVTALQKKFHASATIPIDAWIDSRHLVRRVGLAYTVQAQGGQSAAITMRVDFVGYGPQPRPAIPAVSQTSDLLGLLNNG
jgi:hypothetical protein